MSGPRYFAIFGAMRTGSNLLEKTLEALGDTACYGEAFNPGFISGPRKTVVLGHTVATRDADPGAFLETLIHAEPDRIAGFRIFPDHSKAIMDRALADPRCIRIILTRDPLDSWVSLKIAQTTGQWMLGKRKVRATARVHFDAAEFERFCKARAEHLAWLDRQLARHGTSAIRVDYHELRDPMKLQAIAHAIGSRGSLPLRAPIQRQNPEPIHEKVENYFEMCSHLGMTPEVERPAPLVRREDLIRPGWLPAAYAPLPGAGLAPALALLHRIEVRDHGVAKLAPPELLQRSGFGRLFPTGADTGGEVFTLLADPLERLHWSFLNDVFGPGWRCSKIRHRLELDHGRFPRGEEALRTDYPARRHRRHFNGFLDLVAKAAKGTLGIAMRPEWAPQIEMLGIYGVADRVRLFRYDDFADMVHWLTDLAGVQPFPPGQINGMRQTAAQTLLPIEGVRTPEILARVQELHAADYDAFGFQTPFARCGTADQDLGNNTGNLAPSNGAPS